MVIQKKVDNYEWAMGNQLARLMEKQNMYRLALFRAIQSLPDNDEYKALLCFNAEITRSAGIQCTFFF